MNVIVRNITEYITGACYDLTIKQKLAKSKPSKRMGRKAKGPRSERVWKPGCKVLTTLLSVERRKIMGKKIFSKRILAILLALVMCFSSLQTVASAAGANGVSDTRGDWSYAYYLGQEYLGNASGAAVKPDPVGYGFQGVITSITFTDDAGTSWTFNWSSEANGEWRITGRNVSKGSASAWPKITDGKVYVGYCGTKAYTFTLGNEGSSESWTYTNTQNRHANWFRYIRFIREYTVNVFYQNETGSIVYNGETFTAADPVIGSFHFLYPNGGIIDDSEYKDGEYTEPTTLLPAQYLPQSMIDQGYEIKYATDASGNNVLDSGVTISLLGDNVLNVYCTLIPPTTEDYAIVHNYYVEGTFEGTQSGGNIEVTEGSNFDTIVAGIEKKTSYNSNTYSYISYTVDPHQKVITLTYSRNLPTYDYSVIYDANFDANATASDSENVTGVKDTAKNITVDGNPFSRDNYYFAGWNTERDGSGTTYAAGSTVALTAQNNTEILYAQWQEYPKYDYSVTYNANFGETPATAADEENVSQVYDTTKSISVNANPFTRANYTFLGWATDADGEVVYQAGNTISFTEGGSKELFAVWQEYPKYSYALSYNGNGGALVNSEVAYADEENISNTYSTAHSIEVNENTFSRVNYTFTGWNTEADGSGTPYTAEDAIGFTPENNTLVLFAQWQENPKYDYTVIYNANFDENVLRTDGESVAQVYDTAKVITVDENTFVRANYTFLGWATDADGDVIYQAGDPISFTYGGSEELFAVWQEHPKYDYIVNYNANFGLFPDKAADIENITDTYATTYSITVDENTFSRANHTFIGWSETKDGEVIYSANDVLSFSEGGEKTLYAQWIEHDKYNYTVIYNGNGGTLSDEAISYGDSENLAETYATSHSITVDGNTFSREHYSFAGWNTKADGTGTLYTAEEVIALTAQNNSKTLYAQWIEHNKYDYSVTYNANFGETPATADDEENVFQVYDTSKSITVDENTFVRENYTFIGWSETKNGEVSYNANDVLSFIEGGEKTLYAQWIEHDKYSYTVIYNGNGGTLSDEAISYGDSENLAETYATSHSITVDGNTFSREHYSFAGWNTEADGTGTPYTAEEVIALTAQNNTKTLYAQWTLDNVEYTVEYKVKVDDQPYKDFTGELPEGAPTGGEVPYGTEPEIVPPASITDDTYTYDFTKQEIVGNKIIVYYSFNTPETEPEDNIEIPDDDVPLTDVPQTGDPILQYVGLAITSGVAAILVGKTGKKKEDEE